MAEPMTYDVILRDKFNPENILKYPMGYQESVCFFRLSFGFEDIEHPEVEKMETPVLDSLIYYFDEELLKAEEVKAIMGCLFDNCGHDVQWEVQPCEIVNGCDHYMFLTGFGSMPRGLFMNKMFCIRNLIRDSQSFDAYKALLEGGVPLNIAAYLGGALEVKTNWRGEGFTTIKEYAGYISVDKGAFASIIRGMANNVYCEQDSFPWEDGFGYNQAAYGGYEQICGSVANYQGDNLPPGLDKNTLYHMSDAQVTTLIRFICNNDELTYSTKKES